MKQPDNAARGVGRESDISLYKYIYVYKYIYIYTHVVTHTVIKRIKGKHCE